jgi:hypothetical protein
VKRTFAVLAILVFSVAIANTQYTIEKAVIAGGGGTSTGGTYSLSGTIGQAVAGGPATGSPYSVQSGFWNSDLAPTSAGVFIEGRVTLSGRPIAGAYVVIALGDGTMRQVMTNTFGNFRIADIAAGQTVIIDVIHRRYRFAPQLMDLSDNISGLEIQAL